MIVENSTNQELRTHWNRYLNQDVLEILTNGEWCSLGSIVEGVQFFGFGIISETKLPRQTSRSPCDLRFAKTTLRQGC